jgi:hypothetical protein
MADTTERDRIIDGFEESIGRLRKAQPGSDEHQRILGELQMKQGLMQYIATTYQMRAAEATIREAEATVKNTKYMFWSVIFAAVAAFISLANTLYTNWPKH